MILKLINWIQTLPEYGVYLFLIVSSIVENIFPPWPGDTFTVICGTFAALGVIGLKQSMAALIFGNLIGAWIMYFAGNSILKYVRIYESKIVKPGLITRWIRESISQESMERTEYWFARYGIYCVLFSRFSAGIRFFVSIIAGISKMNLGIFSLFFALGVIIWNSLLLAGGYTLGNEWSRILEWLRIYNIAIIVIIVIAILCLIYWKKIYKSRKRNYD